MLRRIGGDPGPRQCATSSTRPCVRGEKGTMPAGSGPGCSVSKRGVRARSTKPSCVTDCSEIGGPPSCTPADLPAPALRAAVLHGDRERRVETDRRSVRAEIDHRSRVGRRTLRAGRERDRTPLGDLHGHRAGRVAALDREPTLRAEPSGDHVVGRRVTNRIRRERAFRAAADAQHERVRSAPATTAQRQREQAGMRPRRAGPARIYVSRLRAAAKHASQGPRRNRDRTNTRARAAQAGTARPRNGCRRTRARVVARVADQRCLRRRAASLRRTEVRLEAAAPMARQLRPIGVEVDADRSPSTPPRLAPHVQPRSARTRAACRATLPRL